MTERTIDPFLHEKRKGATQWIWSILLTNNKDKTVHESARIPLFAIRLFDHVGADIFLNENKTTLAVLVCAMIASKYFHDVGWIEIVEFAPEFKQFTRKQIAEEELRILQSIDFDLYKVSPLSDFLSEEELKNTEFLKTVTTETKFYQNHSMEEVARMISSYRMQKVAKTINEMQFFVEISK